MWKAIDGYRYPYRISDMAEIERGFPDGTWRRLKPYVTKGGGGVAGNYLFVKLAVFPKGHRRIPVVRLMEGRFLRQRRPGEVTIHRNGLAQDCAAYNLYHSSPAELARSLGGPNRRAVEKIDREGRALALYRSITEAAQKNFMSRCSVSKRCRGLVQHPFNLTGFSFRYESQRGRKRKHTLGGDQA